MGVGEGGEWHLWRHMRAVAFACSFLGILSNNLGDRRSKIKSSVVAPPHDILLETVRDRSQDRKTMILLCHVLFRARSQQLL